MAVRAGPEVGLHRDGGRRKVGPDRAGLLTAPDSGSGSVERGVVTGALVTLCLLLV